MTAIPLSEDDLQQRIMDYAKLHGWRIAHVRAAQVRSGRWATPVTGDLGFPDLVLARAGRHPCHRLDGAVMNERCELTELLVTDCAHCRGNNQTVEEQAKAERLELRARLLTGAIRSVTSWFPARYPGRCANCGHGFGEGAAIRSLPNGYLAECCADEEEAREVIRGA